MRIVDLESGGQIIGDDNAAELRLLLRDPEHDHDAGVLLDRLRIDRLAVERVILPLDPETLFGGGLRRHRRAADGDHRLTSHRRCW